MSTPKERLNHLAVEKTEKYLRHEPVKNRTTAGTSSSSMSQEEQRDAETLSNTCGLKLIHPQDKTPKHKLSCVMYVNRRSRIKKNHHLLDKEDR